MLLLMLLVDTCLGQFLKNTPKMQLRTRETNVNHHLSLSDTDRLRLLVDICLRQFLGKMHRNAVGSCCCRKKPRWIDLEAVVDIRLGQLP